VYSFQILSSIDLFSLREKEEKLFLTRLTNFGSLLFPLSKRSISMFFVPSAAGTAAAAADSSSSSLMITSLGLSHVGGTNPKKYPSE